jgi:hypothetical protein
MATPNNLPTPANQDPSTSYFNNFFAPLFDVSQGVDDAIVSYFEKITASKDSARQLAGSLIYTAKAQNLDPMTVLQQFVTMPTEQLSAYLAMFLNLNRVGTSYLGISSKPVTNKYISRCILP